MNTANKITIVRILLIPVFMVVMLMGFKYSNVLAFVVFVLASVTDGIDGYIARKYNQITSFGKFMDPLADKLLVTSAMLIFIQWGQMSAWAAMIIIAREFAVTGLRLVAAAEGDVIAAGISGKIKTVVSIIAILLMLTPLHSRSVIGGITVDNIAVFFMVITTVWSGIDYFKDSYKILLRSK